MIRKSLCRCRAVATHTRRNRRASKNNLARHSLCSSHRIKNRFKCCSLEAVGRRCSAWHLLSPNQRFLSIQMFGHQQSHSRAFLLLHPRTPKFVSRRDDFGRKRKRIERIAPSLAARRSLSGQPSWADSEYSLLLPPFQQARRSLDAFRRLMLVLIRWRNALPPKCPISSPHARVCRHFH